MESNIIEWVAILVTIIVPSIAVFKFNSEKKKLDAERSALEAGEDKTRIETNLLLIHSFQDLAKTITGLYEQIEEIQKEVIYLRDGIDRLVNQLEKAEMTPVWKPENGDRRKGDPK